MWKYVFALFMIMPIGAQAAIYKCMKDGKVSYSENECEGRGADNRVFNKTSDAGLKEGMAAFERKDYSLAFKLLSPLAQSGNAIAQNAVGRMYSMGQGVTANPDKALLLFKQAASQGLANAKNNLGVMYAAGESVQQDYKQAIVWFTEAANQGFALAMNNLADIYEHGLGVTPNREEATKWRRKSKEMAMVTNITYVTIETAGKKEYDKGLEYYHGWNFAKAAEWFNKAALIGHPEAQLKLASLFENGQGVQKSERQAQYWYQKARSGGHSMDDKRDRVILIDAPHPPPPSGKTKSAIE